MKKVYSGWLKPGAHGRAPPAFAAGSGVAGQSPFSFANFSFGAAKEKFVPASTLGKRGQLLPSERTLMFSD